MLKKFDKKKTLFLILFVILGIIAFQIPFTHIIGSNSKFTGFDFISPITGGFLGSWIGAIAVAIVQIINTIIKKAPIEAITFLRFLPAICAAIYFGTKSKYVNLIPLLCIALFIVHPIGRTVWYYPIAFWFVPVLCSFGKFRLTLNALGATFTAHAVGSTIFLYAFALPASVWKSLMTIVPVERLTFAIGIVVSYLVINNLLNYLVKKFNIKYLESLVNDRLIITSKTLKTNI